MRILLLPRPLFFGTALALLVYWTVLQVAPAAAGLVPSQTTGSTAVASVRDADLGVIQRALEHRLVAQKLHDYGVSTNEVRQRLTTMSDGDVHTLATACKGLPTWGDD